jgi:hypothetical protein
MSAFDKPVVIRLDVTDLRREVDNAALSALLEKGWTVLTSVVIADESGNWMSLVMVPPAPKSEPEYVQSDPVQQKSMWMGFTVGSILTFAAIYTLSALGF